MAQQFYNNSQSQTLEKRMQMWKQQQLSTSRPNKVFFALFTHQPGGCGDSAQTGLKLGLKGQGSFLTAISALISILSWYFRFKNGKASCSSEITMNFKNKACEAHFCTVNISIFLLPSAFFFFFFPFQNGHCDTKPPRQRRCCYPATGPSTLTGHGWEKREPHAFPHPKSVIHIYIHITVGNPHILLEKPSASL